MRHLAIILPFLLCACGQTGGLYLSDSYLASHQKKDPYYHLAPSHNLKPLPEGLS